MDVDLSGLGAVTRSDLEKGTTLFIFEHVSCGAAEK
jgi:hypothetical protein